MTATTISQANAAVLHYRQRIAEVREHVAAAAARAGRSADEVTLMAVCKTVGRAEVDAAYAAGQRDFGENRVQDALAKFATNVPADLKLHMIGSLQTNKVRQVVGAFQLIHSVDRAALATEIDRRAAAAGIIQDVLIQVNVAREEQKHGCDVEELPGLIEFVHGCSNVALRGLMTMAPLTATAEEARPVFVELREVDEQMRRRYPEVALGALSMGMTNDYQAAVEEGATIVRVGRAIFA